jgi:predicted outer membrane protein
MRMGGRDGRMMGLSEAEMARMNDQNIVAHLAAGDSLEIALSQAVLAHAQNQSVRDFAQRMITAHTEHMLQGRQVATQDGITPTPLPGDTVDAAMVSRMINRLTNNGMAGMNMSNSSGSSANIDRQSMMAEVAMHRHMLRELTMIQPRATSVARQLVDQTIPIVRQHLADADSLWRQVGGGMGRNGNASR